MKNSKTHIFTGMKRSQKYNELNPMINLIKEKETQSYLEIGARHGCTFYDVMTSLPVGSIGVAVDFPGACWGVDSSKHKLREVCNHLRDRGYRISLYFGDSTSDEIINLVKNHGSFDAIFIDGDHRYEGVKKDYENYKDLANKLIAFHDIDGQDVVWRSDRNMVIEVPQLWEEIKNNHKKFHEFIDRENEPDRPMGIGVLEV